MHYAGASTGAYSWCVNVDGQALRATPTWRQQQAGVPGRVRTFKTEDAARAAGEAALPVESDADQLARRNAGFTAAAEVAPRRSNVLGDPLAADDRASRLGAGVEWAHMRRDR